MGNKTTKAVILIQVLLILINLVFPFGWTLALLPVEIIGACILLIIIGIICLIINVFIYVVIIFLSALILKLIFD